MNISDFRALVEQRRSIRGYDESRGVSDEVIRTILDCARWAASGGGSFPKKGSLDLPSDRGSPE